MFVGRPLEDSKPNEHVSRVGTGVSEVSHSPLFCWQAGVDLRSQVTVKDVARTTQVTVTFAHPRFDVKSSGVNTISCHLHDGQVRAYPPLTHLYNA